MPPAGLEPAALCLASSIRLSLTARQSWGCWLDYILDITVPTRIVSEDPVDKYANGFLRITQSFWIFTRRVPEALRASPHMGPSTLVSSVPHQGSNKADALSAELRGHMLEAAMLAVNDRHGQLRKIRTKERDRRGGDLLFLPDRRIA